LDKDEEKLVKKEVKHRTEVRLLREKIELNKFKGIHI